MVKPVVTDTAVNHLRTRDVSKTDAVYTYNIMGFRSGCLLYFVGKHFNLSLFKTFVEMVSHFILIP